MTVLKKRNVTVDSNVLIAYIVSKRENTVIAKVIEKSTNEDKLMLTDVIYDECIRYATKPRSRVTKKEAEAKLKKISPEIIKISPVPPNKELMKLYKIRDRGDLKILYSAEITNSVIIVTQDKDFSDVEGVRATIMNPKEYVFEKVNNKKVKSE